MKNTLCLLFLLYSLKLATSVQILPAVSEEVIVKNSSLTLICWDNEPLQWSYPLDGLSEKTATESQNENGTRFNNLTINGAHYMDTGYFKCYSRHNVSRFAQIYLYVFDEENLIALPSDAGVTPITAKVHDDVLVPCKPTSPDVQVTLDAVNGEITMPSYSSNYSVYEGFFLNNINASFDGQDLECCALPSNTTSSKSHCRSITFLLFQSELMEVGSVSNFVHVHYKSEQLLTHAGGNNNTPSSSWEEISKDRLATRLIEFVQHRRCKVFSNLCAVITPRLQFHNVSDLKYDPKHGFTLSNVKIADSDTFSCAASYNDTESKTTFTFDLRVNSATSEVPSPYIDASNAYNLAEGDTASLNCSIIVSADEKIGLEWNVPTDDVAKKMILEDNNVYKHDKHQVVYRLLTIGNLTKSDQGVYTCEVMGYSPDKSVTHQLHIHDKTETFLNIAIHEQARELSLKAGVEQVVWVANVTAYPKATISWFDPEDREIKTDPNGKYVITNKSPNTMLEVKNINIWDFGIYQLRASNIHGTEVVNFSLTVEDSPRPTLKNDRKFYSLKQNYPVECFLTAYPLPRVTWSVINCDDYPTCENNVYENISMSQFEETNLSSKPYQMKSTLNFTANGSKILRCEASNSEGSADSSALFLVSDVENGFAINSDLKEIVVGDDVEISCASSKYAYHSNVTWYKDTVEDLPAKHLPGIRTTNFTTKFSHGSTLHIKNIQKIHGGNYICRAAQLNNSSSDYETEKSITIDVKSASKPNITRTNFNNSQLWVTSGKQIQMEIHVDGTPTPSVLWYKDKKLIQTNTSAKESTRIVLYDSNRTLLIRYAAFVDEGEYLCVVVNKAGNDSAKVKLWLTDKPEEHEHTIFLVAFCVAIIFFLICTVWSMIKIRKEKSLRKELKETGLLNFEEGAIHSLNPELGVEEQADLLPYDKKWEFPREKLKLGKLIGSGAFGEVRKAEADGIIDENTITIVAVKTVKRNADSLYVRALASELKIMIHLGRHLNVVNLLGACTKDLRKRELIVIVEYCKFGNLHDFLLKQRNNFINQIDENGELDLSITSNNRNYGYAAMNGRINSTRSDTSVEETPIGSDGYLISKDNEPDWRSNYRGDYHNTTVRPIKTADLICWLFQVARGMDYLASRKVLHGDLAARNVLLADDNIVKICDFGLAKSMYQSEQYQRQKSTLVPVKWMAVESIRDRVFSTQSDVWSYGITMWELFSLSVTPYPGIEDLNNLFNKLESGYRLEKPAFATEEIYAVMKDCWHARPLLRPTFAELSERLGRLLEDGVRSHYTKLNEVYIKMNADMNSNVDYLAMLNSPLYHPGYEEPRYVNIPCREASDPEDDVEMKPMLKKPDDKIENKKPICFSNQSYTDVANIRRPTYVNTTTMS